HLSRWPSWMNLPLGCFRPKVPQMPALSHCVPAALSPEPAGRIDRAIRVRRLEEWRLGYAQMPPDLPALGEALKPVAAKRELCMMDAIELHTVEHAGTIVKGEYSAAICLERRINECPVLLQLSHELEPVVVAPDPNVLVGCNSHCD